MYMYICTRVNVFDLEFHDRAQSAALLRKADRTLNESEVIYKKTVEIEPLCAVAVRAPSRRKVNRRKCSRLLKPNKHERFAEQR